MKLKLDVTPDLATMMAAEIKAGEKAVTEATREAGSGLKTAWRGQIAGAGLGQRLARTIRSEQYPRGQPSLNAAALVWSVLQPKAPDIINAHDTGPLIRSRTGFWLAIPTEAAGKSRRGGRITPRQWEQRSGLRLRFVYRRTRAKSSDRRGTAQQGRSGGGVAVQDRPGADHRADLPVGPTGKVAEAAGSRSRLRAGI